MRWAVVQFPGTWSDGDCYHVLHDVLGQDAAYVWHRDTDLDGFDAVVLPGGFSYGDHLRTGAIARFSPVMASVVRHAARGGLVIGICNGFQILCEAGLLPGVLMRNDSLQFRCMDTHLRVETTHTPFTSACASGDVLRIPISHGEGRYYADDATLQELADEDRIGRACDDAARRVAQAVKGHLPQPRRLARALIPAAEGGDVDAAADAVDEDVVVGLGEVATTSSRLARCPSHPSFRCRLRAGT